LAKGWRRSSGRAAAVEEKLIKIAPIIKERMVTG
jgi:hypothetical protein